MLFENLVNHHKNKERRDGVFKINDKELDDLLTLADDRECEKLTRARRYDDTLSMKYLDLRGKDLSGKKFWNVDFSRMDLSDANLNGCVFEFCEFGHTNLSGATMIASRVICSRFNHANFKQVDISNSLFIDVEMMSCKFDKTKLRDCRTDVLFIEPEVSPIAIDPTGTEAVSIRTKPERKYICTCGLEIDRDLNAAINIKNEGLKLLA